ncbi:MAG: transcription termination/antitermination factor NusG [Planctomycetaceae bacterium]|nr:transcription termination/antitermination factor NusG [Planctomycetaceae bacterium]
MDWYILKVQSNRERSIADALKRKVAIEGLEKYVDVDNILVPTEKVTEFKGGKKKVVERKLYPGYIVVRMHINDDSWFAIRETSGIGDFTGAGGKPSPMLAHEIARIVQTDEQVSDDAPKLDIKFKTGDRVKVKDGTFEGFEGEVGTIDAQSGKVQVMISIFGRSTPVELEYWQVEGV